MGALAPADQTFECTLAALDALIGLASTFANSLAKPDSDFEVADLMRHFLVDYDAIVQSRQRALPYMKAAHREMWKPDIGMNRFIGRTRAD